MSIITLDSSLTDLIYEFCSIIEVTSSDSEKDLLSEFNKYIKDDDKIDDSLFNQLINYIPEIISINEKEIESFLNLVNNIFIESKNYELLIKFNENLIQDLNNDETNQSFINKRKINLKNQSVISSLTNVFNLSQLTNDFKLQILNIILSIIEQVKLNELINNLINDLISWLKLNEFPIIFKPFLFKLIDLSNSIELSQILLSNYELNQDELNKLIKLNLESFKILNISKFQSYESKYKQLISEYSIKSIEEFSTVDFIDLNKDIIILKNKYLNLIKLSESQNQLSLSELSKVLQVSNVEIFLINGIKYGYLNGKIDQINDNFNVYSINVILTIDWLKIKTQLIDYKEKINKIKSLVERSKK